MWNKKHPSTTRTHNLKSMLLSWGTVFALVLVYLMLALQKDLRFAVPSMVVGSAFIVCLLLITLYLNDQRTPFLSFWRILSVSLILRLLFVFRLPELSDDMFRYLFDGLQFLDSHNPYAVSPASGALQNPAIQSLASKVNHPDLVTIYPPASQFVFLLGSFISPHVWGIKLLLCIMDLGSCALLMFILSCFNLPMHRSVLYAWHPLVILEIAGSGHIDAAGIFFFLLSAGLVLKTLLKPRAPAAVADTAKAHMPNARYLLSGSFLAASVLIKLLPLVYFPLYIKMQPPEIRRRVVAGAAIGSLLLCVPFLPDLVHISDTLVVYARHWEFSGLAYRSLKAAGLSGIDARVLLTVGFCFVWAGVYLYPNRGVVSDSQQKYAMPFEIFIFKLYIITLAFLAFTPTLHPWYALYLAAILPFFPHVPGIVLSWSVLLSYRVLILYTYAGQWLENDMIPVLIWSGPILAMILLQFVRNRLASRPPGP